MNERIEAYLKQHHCLDYFDRYGETISDEHYFMYRKDVDEFIKLIVEECIEIVKGEMAAELLRQHLNKENS